MTPQELKASILQLAIQGKLVEQRPEEGTGEELYQQIQAEKQLLTKAGKIKKEKPLPEIVEDEIPFDIPENWKWYRLGELFNIVNGFTPLKSNPEFWEEGDIPWFTIEDVHRQGRFISSTEKFITRKALVCSFSHMSTTSELTTSVARSRILFILRTHAIWSMDLSCSVTPSFSAYSFTNREKRACACFSVSARWE